MSNPTDLVGNGVNKGREVLRNDPCSPEISRYSIAERAFQIDHDRLGPVGRLKIIY